MGKKATPRPVKKSVTRRGQNASSPSATRRRREGPACTPCIRSKKGCVSVAGDPNIQCARCKERGIVCMWPAANEGPVVACDACNARSMKCIKDGGEGTCLFCAEDGRACVYTPRRVRGVAEHHDAVEDAEPQAGPSGTHGRADLAPSVTLDGEEDSDDPTTHGAHAGSSSLSIDTDLTRERASSGPSSARSWRSVCGIAPTPEEDEGDEEDEENEVDEGL